MTNSIHKLFKLNMSNQCWLTGQEVRGKIWKCYFTEICGNRFFLCMVILVTGPECHWKLFYRDVISAIGIFKNINIYSVFVFRRFSVDFNLFINIIKIWICKSLLFSEFTFFRSFYSHWNWIYIFTLITIMMLILRRQYSSTFLKIIFICKCFDY